MLPKNDALKRALRELRDWAALHGFPLWWEKGADHILGGFHEKISLAGEPVVLPKRARVQPRQIYSFAQAAKLGWQGDAAGAVKHGLDFYLRFYRRPDGLMRTLVAPDGAPLDEAALFYDQAFALLGLHAAFQSLGQTMYRDQARQLLRQWSLTQSHPNGGFVDSAPRRLPLCANPHMHLLESCLAWQGSDPDGPWRQTADRVAELALTHLIDPQSGALREFFTDYWTPMPGDAGRIIEPGHQFEWAWLLIRWGRLAGREEGVTAGLRLIEIGEQYGVDPVRGVAFNSLLDNLTPHDRNARLWPQTERLKAHCLAAEVTGDAMHWEQALLAARGLQLYLDLPIAGLWRDVLTVDQGFIEEPAPASSFYHIVCAIVEFDRVMASPQ